MRIAEFTILFNCISFVFDEKKKIVEESTVAVAAVHCRANIFQKSTQLLYTQNANRKQSYGFCHFLSKFQWNDETI